MRLLLKDYLTIANAASGLLAIAFYFIFGYFASVGLVLLALVFDFFDGIAARGQKSQNDFGIQLDSLADAVSFAAAPPLLLFWFYSTYGFPVGLPLAAGFLFLLGAGVFFLSCALIRLAKFNLQKEKGVYYGLPSPIAAVLVLVLGWLHYYLAMLLLLILGVAMLSQLRFKKVF